MVSWRHIQEAYGGRRVFLTGHTGFKGAWLMAALHLAGAEIKGYALPPEYPNGLFDLLSPLSGVDSCLADIRDRERLRQELAAFRPDYVFHLAAQPLVRRSYEIPSETFDINVTGTASLLEAVGSFDGPCTVVAITTDKVYENKETGVLYRETDRLGGYDPYSTSKACAELVISSFRQSFFHPDQHAAHGKAIASARAGNVIGGGDWSRDRIVPDIVRALQSRQPVDVRNPGSVRPWQHVLEPIAGYLQLGDLLRRYPARFGGAYNFGPQPADHLSVKALVETAIATWGEGSWRDCSSPSAPHEAGVLKLDISKADRELGWVPKLTAREAIEWSLRWYRQPAGHQRAYAFEQIKSYFSE
ncbi:MAG TPA: CDP-glucose 4,6-dehydratase [Puia sp.]|nr:CDP-glucose 4,6-dehydratase [Puia sp.]